MNERVMITFTSTHHHPLIGYTRAKCPKVCNSFLMCLLACLLLFSVSCYPVSSHGKNVGLSCLLITARPFHWAWFTQSKWWRWLMLKRNSVWRGCNFGNGSRFLLLQARLMSCKCQTRNASRIGIKILHETKSYILLRLYYVGSQGFKGLLASLSLFLR